MQGKVRCICTGLLNYLCKFICTDEHDLQEVLAALYYGISDVWLLGLSLGIRSSTLDMIEAEYRSSREGLTRVIYHWLRRRDIVRLRQHEDPTWKVLVDAVDRINPHLAMRIRWKFMYYH